MRVPEAVVEEGAGTIACGVTASDELRQGFGGKFFVSERVSCVVFSLLEPGEEVDAVCFVACFEALADAGFGYASEVFDCADAFGEEGVWWGN